MNKTLKSVRLFASVGILTASTLLPVSSVFAEEIYLLWKNKKKEKEFFGRNHLQ